jgi:hypothetical protein
MTRLTRRQILVGTAAVACAEKTATGYREVPVAWNPTI